MKLDAIDLKEKLRIDSHYDQDQTTHLDIAEYSSQFSSFSSSFLQVFALPMNTQRIHILNPNDEKDDDDDDDEKNSSSRNFFSLSPILCVRNLLQRNIYFQNFIHRF